MKTLAMLKMEKNFIAVLEKGYPRKPYERYPLGYLIDRLDDEFKELIDAYDTLNYEAMKSKLADLSNIIDYIFEALCQKE